MLFKTPCCIPSTYSPSQGKPPHHHHPPPTRKICYKKSHNLAMVLRTGWTGEWSSANWRKRSKTTALRLNYDWKWMIPEKNDAIECLWKEVFDNKYDADDDGNCDNSNWWLQWGIQARSQFLWCCFWWWWWLITLWMQGIVCGQDATEFGTGLKSCWDLRLSVKPPEEKNISNFCLSWSMMSTRRDHVMKS